jgi:hypothetical protein
VTSLCFCHFTFSAFLVWITTATYTTLIDTVIAHSKRAFASHTHHLGVHKMERKKQKKRETPPKSSYLLYSSIQMFRVVQTHQLSRLPRAGSLANPLTCRHLKCTLTSNPIIYPSKRSLSQHFCDCTQHVHLECYACFGPESKTPLCEACKAKKNAFVVATQNNEFYQRLINASDQNNVVGGNHTQYACRHTCPVKGGCCQHLSGNTNGRVQHELRKYLHPAYHCST